MDFSITCADGRGVYTQIGSARGVDQSGESSRP